MRFWGSSKLDEIGWCWMHIQAWIWWQGILLQSQFSLFLCILKPEAYAQKLDRSKTPAQRQNHIMKWNPDSRCWVRVSEAVQFAMQFITIFPSRTLHWKLVNVNARRGRSRRSVGQPRMSCLWLHYISVHLHQVIKGVTCLLKSFSALSQKEAKGSSSQVWIVLNCWKGLSLGYLRKDFGYMATSCRHRSAMIYVEQFIFTPVSPSHLHSSLKNVFTGLHWNPEKVIQIQHHQWSSWANMSK